MAGTLTISTLSDGTNSTSSTNCIQGSAKAWVNFNGSAGTVIAAYNVGSITKNGTGDYTLNFTSALADGNYAAVSSSTGYSVSDNGCNSQIYGSASAGTPTTKTSTQLRVSWGSNSTRYDAANLSWAVFR